jgi:hypothetical protein
LTRITVGNDIRKLIVDGYSQECVVGTDVQQGIVPQHVSFSHFVPNQFTLEFWDMGHQLFRSTPETFPVKFIRGDFFDPSHCAVTAPHTGPDTLSTPRPDLKALNSLNPLQGHVSVIHVSAFFHLFSEEKQLLAARALAGLLSPEPGSMIFGQHVIQPIKGLYMLGMRENDGMFCHSPESWMALWDGEVFEKDSVRVETEVVEVEKPDFVTTDMRYYWLTWSVTRL